MARADSPVQGIRILRWARHEVAHSRKVKGPLLWVAMPTKHGRGYCRLVGRHGAAGLGVWAALVELAGNRGVDDRGTIEGTLEDAAALSRLPVAEIRAVIPTLIENGWVEVVNGPQSPITSAVGTASHDGGMASHDGGTLSHGGGTTSHDDGTPSQRVDEADGGESRSAAPGPATNRGVGMLSHDGGTSSHDVGTTGQDKTGHDRREEGRETRAGARAPLTPSDVTPAVVIQCRSLYEAKYHTPEWHRADASHSQRRQDEHELLLLTFERGLDGTVEQFRALLESRRSDQPRWLWALVKDLRAAAPDSGGGESESEWGSEW